jgi:hypothetical protein
VRNDAATRPWPETIKKQKRVQRHEISHKGDQYTFIGMSASAKAIIAYRSDKRVVSQFEIGRTLFAISR